MNYLMSDQQQSAAPTLSPTPWLPDTTPRVAAPTRPTATATPKSGRRAIKGFNPPTHVKRRRRFPVVALVMVILLAGAGFAAYKHLTKADKADSSSDSGEVVQGLAVQTEAFSFLLPEAPAVEPLANVVIGIQTSGTQWTVESGTYHLQVVALNFGVALDEPTQQAAFDEVINGRTTQATGTILSDTWILDGGVYQRDTIVAVPGGMMHMKSYGKGAWAVFMFAPSSGTDRPPGFTEFITSFIFV